MNEALAKWVEVLRQHPLPALKANVERLRQLSASEQCDMGRLATLIESDPGLSLLLLRHINELRHKHLRSEITSPRHALMMLGLQQFRRLLPQAPLAEGLPAEQQPRLKVKYCQSYHAAYQARDWATLRRDLDPEEVATAALLGNLAETLLSLHAAVEVDKVHHLMHQEEMAPEEAEYVVFGFTFDQLTLELARVWHLPNLLCDSMQAENASLARVLNVMLAVQLARRAPHDWYSRSMAKLTEEIAHLLLSDSAATATLLHRNAVEAAGESTIYGVSHAAALLLYPAKDPLAKAARGPQPTPAPVRGEPTTALTSAEGEFCLVPQRDSLLRALKQLNAPQGALPLKEVIRLTLEGMHDGLGLNRVVFAGLSPNRDQLRASFMLGCDNDPAFKQFTIELGGHNLFVRLLDKQQALWLNDNNRKKFFSIIPINFHKLINNDSFFVMSLLVHGKPLGLFYADRKNRQCRLDETAYKRFRQLVTLAGQHIARHERGGT